MDASSSESSLDLVTYSEPRFWLDEMRTNSAVPWLRQLTELGTLWIYGVNYQANSVTFGVVSVLERVRAAFVSASPMLPVRVEERNVYEYNNGRYLFALRGQWNNALCCVRLEPGFDREGDPKVVVHVSALQFRMSRSRRGFTRVDELVEYVLSTTSRGVSAITHKDHFARRSFDSVVRNLDIYPESTEQALRAYSSPLVMRAISAARGVVPLLQLYYDLELAHLLSPTIGLEARVRMLSMSLLSLTGAFALVRRLSIAESSDERQRLRKLINRLPPAWRGMLIDIARSDYGLRVAVRRNASDDEASSDKEDAADDDAAGGLTTSSGASAADSMAAKLAMSASECAALLKTKIADLPLDATHSGAAMVLSGEHFSMRLPEYLIASEGSAREHVQLSESLRDHIDNGGANGETLIRGSFESENAFKERVRLHTARTYELLERADGLNPRFARQIDAAHSDAWRVWRSRASRASRISTEESGRSVEFYSLRAASGEGLSFIALTATYKDLKLSFVDDSAHEIAASMPRALSLSVLDERSDAMVDDRRPGTFVLKKDKVVRTLLDDAQTTADKNAVIVHARTLQIKRLRVKLAMAGAVRMSYVQRTVIDVRVVSKSFAHRNHSRGHVACFAWREAGNESWAVSGEPLRINARNAAYALRVVGNDGCPLIIGREERGGSSSALSRLLPESVSAIESGGVLLLRPSLISAAQTRTWVTCTHHDFMGFELLVE